MKAVKRINFLEHWFAACTIGVLTDLILVLYSIYVSILELTWFWLVPVAVLFSFAGLCVREYVRLTRYKEVKPYKPKRKIVLESDWM